MNFFALGLGALLAVSIFFVVNDPASFQANVLGIQDKEMLEKREWDLWYKFVDKTLDVYLSDKENYSKVDVIVSYDVENVKFDLNNIEYQGIFVENFLGDWILKLSFNLDDIDFDESLFVVSFVGENEQIVLSEANGILDGKLVLFDIGNLNEGVVHR